MKAKEKQIESIKDWVNASIVDCAENLERNIDLQSSSMKCGNLIIGEENESVQVQVFVTRNEEDFLDDFQMEEIIK